MQLFGEREEEKGKISIRQKEEEEEETEGKCISPFLPTFQPGMGERRVGRRQGIL